MSIKKFLTGQIIKTSARHLNILLSNEMPIKWCLHTSIPERDNLQVN